MEKTVSIVTCAHNEQEYIEDCLRSVMDQTLKPSQVIVVLDRCTDDTPTIVRKYPVQVIEKVIREWENSYAENLEIARQKAEGEYYAIVDADVELDKDYFEKTTARFNSGIVGVSGRMVTASSGLLGKFMRLWEKTYYFSPFKTHLPAGCALVIKKKFLDEIGGFKDVPAPDTYLHQKALQHGLGFIFINNTKVHHCRKITLRRVIYTQIEYGKRRRRLGISFRKTLLHTIFRLRPFVLYGWFKGEGAKENCQ